MAKSNADFNIKTVSARDAHSQLSSLRSGRGGRTSKFAPILEAVQSAKKGQLVTVEGVRKNDVQAMRSYLYRTLDREEFKIKSARDDEDKNTYTVVAGRAGDFE